MPAARWADGSAVVETPALAATIPAAAAKSNIYPDCDVDPSLAIIVGVVIGSVLTWVITLFQRGADQKARASEREYERLREGSRLLRLSVIEAAQLHHSRSFRGLFDLTAWPSLRWASFGRTLAGTGSALSLVADEIKGPVADEYETAAEVLLEAIRADPAKLKRYIAAALALRQLVEAKARGLH